MSHHQSAIVRRPPADHAKRLAALWPTVAQTVRSVAKTTRVPPRFRAVETPQLIVAAALTGSCNGVSVKRKKTLARVGRNYQRSTVAYIAHNCTFVNELSASGTGYRNTTGHDVMSVTFLRVTMRR